MKRSNLAKLVGTGVLSLSLAIAPSILPASAQTGTDAPAGTNTGVDSRAGYTENDRDFDWGWLGLLGLLGLAGLTRKPEERVSYREPDVASRSSYRD
jgi:hypothetical protein